MGALDRILPALCVVGALPFTFRVPALLVFLLPFALEKPAEEPALADRPERILPVAAGEPSPSPHAIGARLYKYIEGVHVQGMAMRHRSKGIPTIALRPTLMRALRV